MPGSDTLYVDQALVIANDNLTSPEAVTIATAFYIYHELLHKAFGAGTGGDFMDSSSSFAAGSSACQHLEIEVKSMDALCDVIASMHGMTPTPSLAISELCSLLCKRIAAINASPGMIGCKASGHSGSVLGAPLADAACAACGC